MTTIASQITSLTVVYSTAYSDADQRNHQSSASLAIVWGIHRDRWIPRTKGQLRGKCFHLMTSSWIKHECYHDDVIKWKHFPRYWPFVRGISPVTGEFPAQRPVTRSFDVSFDLHLNKRLSKQLIRRWFETPSRSFWRHCNGYTIYSPFQSKHSHCHANSIAYTRAFSKQKINTTFVCSIYWRRFSPLIRDTENFIQLSSLCCSSRNVQSE